MSSGVNTIGTSSSGASTINFSGVSSGIDTESIISALVAVRQQPITALQNQKSDMQSKQAAIAKVSAIVTSIQSAAAALDSADAFSVTVATSSDTTVATATTSAGAQPGSHTLQVLALAAAQRVTSASFSSSSTPLGLSNDGQVDINGTAIDVTTADTLQSLVSKINTANAGVTASVVSPTTGTFQIVLASDQTGTANEVQMSDVGSGTILSTTLGLIGSTKTNSDTGYGFADATTSIATLLGHPTASSGTVTINGQAVSIDFNTDSLTSIATKINAVPGIGVTASVQSTTDSSGTTKQGLVLTGASSATIVDSNNVLANLGIVRAAPTSEVVDAKDAQFVLDGITMTRSTNTVSDALTGVTLNLLKDTGSPTTVLTVASDTDTLTQNINTLVTQYNTLVSEMGADASYDPTTNTAGVLFGDAIVQGVYDGFADAMTSSVPGLSGSITALADIGITMDQTGNLNVDSAALSSALANNLSDVQKLFASMGTATDSQVSYVSSTDKTVASGVGGYAVNITAAASQASLTAGPPVSGAGSETLTFAGGSFGSVGHVVSIAANSSLSDIVATLNADKTVSSVLTASISNGNLKLTALKYGSAATFTVSSSQDASTSASGIGTTPQTATGTDVAGTINGEAATGSGQVLTGNAGNATTDGLKLLIAGSATGPRGTITFAKGIGAQAYSLATSATDYTSGALTSYTNSLTDQENDIDTQVTTLQSQVSDYETTLRTQFSNMEAAISQLTSASTALSQLTSSSTG